MSNNNMRHRTGGKHNPNYNTSSHDDAHSRSKLANATRRTNLHSGVWQRIIGIVISFTILMLLISSVGKGNRIVSTGGSSNGVRTGTTGNIIGVNKSKGNHGSTNPLFVTIVMPSVVKPEGRPLRLTNIAKTWGPSSRAIYVVHSTDEFQEGADNRVDDPSNSDSYPQILLVPEDITVEKGVERLEHVIRTVSRDIDPDFAFFVNDHTFVLPDNLCKFLRNHDSSEDLYGGHALKGGKETAFNSGAAGYVVSRSTIKKLINEWDQQNPTCSAKNASKWLQGNPGLVTAQCFDQVLHTSVIDTRDKDLSHKFHAFGLVRTVTGKVDDWYLNKHVELDNVLGVDSLHHHKPQNGILCCSPSTISFHYVEAGESTVLWEVLQKVHNSPAISQDDLKGLMTEIWPRDREGLGFYAHGLPAAGSQVWDDLIGVVRKISGGVGGAMC